MANDITDVIGGIPYRLALCGGWMDQPFVSERDPSPPGSMTVVAVEPDFRFMDCAVDSPFPDKISFVNAMVSSSGIV